MPRFAWLLLAAAGYSLVAGTSPAQRPAAPRPTRPNLPGAYRVQVLYDLYNAEHARYEAPTRYDTLFCTDSLRYRNLHYGLPWRYTPYLLYQTSSVRLPALRRGGHEAAVSREVGRLLRKKYFSAHKILATTAAAVRHQEGPPTPENTRLWSRCDVTGATLLITPRHDSLVCIGVEQADGGAERKSRGASYVFQLRGGRIRNVTEPLREQLDSSYYYWLRRQAERADQCPEPCSKNALGVEWLEFAPRGLLVGYVVCVPLPGAQNE